jgi:hypothetical protein
MIFQMETKKVYVIFIHSFSDDKVKESKMSVTYSRNKKGKNKDILLRCYDVQFCSLEACWTNLLTTPLASTTLNDNVIVTAIRNLNITDEKLTQNFGWEP